MSDEGSQEGRLKKTEGQKINKTGFAKYLDEEVFKQMVQHAKRKFGERSGKKRFFYFYLDSQTSIKDIEGVIEKEKWKKVSY